MYHFLISFPGSNLLFKHEVLCDSIFVDCIVDKRMNLKVNTDKDGNVVYIIFMYSVLNARSERGR